MRSDRVGRELLPLRAANDPDVALPPKVAWEDFRMASSTERVAKMRARRKKGRLVISVEVDEADLREIAVAGYEDATSTDREAQSKAVSLFLSDSVNC